MHIHSAIFLIKKRGIFLLILIFFAILATNCQPKESPGRLKVSTNGHYLVYEDGKPFFWLGDTAWELFHRLTKEEIKSYLENRRDKGFNVIQAVALAEFDGLRIPNRYGELPLQDLDPLKPNEKYFELIDYTLELARKNNLYIALLPTWGDKVTKLWGLGPVIFNKDNAYQYALWLGKRYKDNTSIIWILGGDRPPVADSVDYRSVWRYMAKGILDGTEHKALITYHPPGGKDATSTFLHREDWLDMNMIQSGHGFGHDMPVWEIISRDWSLLPAKPVLDAEPNYEDHPVKPWPKWDSETGYYRDYDIRKQSYRSVFAGGCGITYGHHSIWQFWSPREEKVNHADRYWTEAIDRPGAFQVGYLKKLIESRPQLTRIPDQTIIESGQGEGGEYITATRDSKGSYVMIYIPVGKKISINTSSFKSGKVRVWWFNPALKEVNEVGVMNRKISMEFTPPSLGVGNDWVLIIDDPEFNYPIPF